MYTQNKPFQQRVARVDADKRVFTDKKTRVLYEKRPDGLLVPVATKYEITFPWKALILAVICLVSLKAFLYAHFGDDQLDARIALMTQGSAFEKGVAYVMQPEPVTQWIAHQMEYVVPRYAAAP